MTKLALTRLGVAVGGLTLSLTVAAGVASADPLDPIVNTTCNYQQVMAALNAQNPMYAQFINSSPKQQAAVHQFLDAPPDQRRQMAEKIQNRQANQPYIQQYFGVLQQVFNTCNNY